MPACLMHQIRDASTHPLQQMTLEEYEAVLAEKRAGLNQTREAAYKADEKQVRSRLGFVSGLVGRRTTRYGVARQSMWGGAPVDVGSHANQRGWQERVGSEAAYRAERQAQLLQARNPCLHPKGCLQSAEPLLPIPAQRAVSAPPPLPHPASRPAAPGHVGLQKARIRCPQPPMLLSHLVFNVCGVCPRFPARSSRA